MTEFFRWIQCSLCHSQAVSQHQQWAVSVAGVWLAAAALDARAVGLCCSRCSYLRSSLWLAPRSSASSNRSNRSIIYGKFPVSAHFGVANETISDNNLVIILCTCNQAPRQRFLCIAAQMSMWAVYIETRLLYLPDGPSNSQFFRECHWRFGAPRLCYNHATLATQALQPLLSDMARTWKKPDKGISNGVEKHQIAAGVGLVGPAHKTK